MALFTPEELEELRRADEALDDSFVQTKEEIELLISVLKEYSSEEEMQKMNKVLAMFQM